MNLAAETHVDRSILDPEAFLTEQSVVLFIKLMQNYFEKKHQQEREIRKARLDVSDRGMNWHLQSIAKFRDGALHVSKDAIRKIDTADLTGSTFAKVHTGREEQFKMRGEKKQKKKLTFEQIQKERETNEDFMRGKKFKKHRGAMGKLHKKILKQDKPIEINLPLRL